MDQITQSVPLPRPRPSLQKAVQPPSLAPDPSLDSSSVPSHTIPQQPLQTPVVQLKSPADNPSPLQIQQSAQTIQAAMDQARLPNDPGFQHPLLLTAVMIVGTIVLVNAYNRMRAAQINAVAANLDHGTRRHFGLPPGNLFEYHKGEGWKRLKSAGAFHGPIYDERSHHLARVQDEHDEKKSRRLRILWLITVVGAAALLAKILIVPLPLSALLVTSFEEFWQIWLTVTSNLTNIASALLGIGPDSFWRYLVGYFMFFAALSGVLAFGKRLVILVWPMLPALVLEILYLLGFQGFRGAKVFDAPPQQISHDPRQTPSPSVSSPTSQSRSLNA